MKIRDIILVLTAGLGLTLVVVAMLFLRDELGRLHAAERLQASNTVREELLVASTALARERTKTFLQLSSLDQSNLTDTIGGLRRNADDALAAARQALEVDEPLLPRARESADTLIKAQGELAALRTQIDRVISSDNVTLRQQEAQAWLGEATSLIDRLQAARLDLLNDNRPTDAMLAAEANIRAYSDFLHEAIAYNEAIGIALLRSIGRERADHIATLERTIGKIELAWQMIGNELDASLGEPVLSAVEEAQSLYRQTYNPLSLTLVNAAPNIGIETVMASWERTSDQSLDALGALQQTLLASSRSRLDHLVAVAQRSGFTVAIATLGGVFAAVLILLVVRRRVIEPIGQISGAMVSLANNDLDTPVPRAKRLDEVGVMTNALRTFKANAIARQRTQHELQRVHQDLKATYDQLRHDLEAAATIQLAMLPAPDTVSGISHSGLYSPSSLIAGDTYNVIARPDGGVGFFQIDVAGHGAAAALVSVAGQHTLSQAILTRNRDARLEDIVAEVNRDWPEELPYFTTILGEIDPVAPIGRLVQAGHPSPVLIHADGRVEYIGGSGFPVGMLAQATYETLEFTFRTGDRLLIYSDGVIETENPQGDLYSEARLLDLVSANAARPTADLLAALETSLRSWRGSSDFTDDVSVLVVERTNTRSGHVIH